MLLMRLADLFSPDEELPGLVRRREAEKALFNTPVDLIEKKD